MTRSKAVSDFLWSISDELTGFEGVDFQDISATDSEGENALHIAVSRGEYQVAKELIALGIDIDARGDLGNTPLHLAASSGKMDFVKLLVESGADVHALNEGYPPFTVARMMGHDAICEYLAAAMKSAQALNPEVWLQAKIDFLKREIKRLEGLL